MSSFCRELDGDGEALPAACTPRELFSCSQTGLFQPSAPVSNCVPSLPAAASLPVFQSLSIHAQTHLHTPAHTKWGRRSRGESTDYFHSGCCLQPQRGLKSPARASPAPSSRWALRLQQKSPTSSSLRGSRGRSRDNPSLALRLFPRLCQAGLFLNKTHSSHWSSLRLRQQRKTVSPSV